jgi:hypothetical protein
MNKAVNAKNQDKHYKIQALSHLAEARRILRLLSTERQRNEYRRVNG